MLLKEANHLPIWKRTVFDLCNLQNTVSWLMFVIEGKQVGCAETSFRCPMKLLLET